MPSGWRVGCTTRTSSLSTLRTTMTSTLMNERFEALDTPSVKITEVEDFYLAKWKVYVNELSTRLPKNNADTVMVLGHCPGVEDLVEALTDQWVTMPTATIARLSYNEDSWAGLKKQSPRCHTKAYRRHSRSTHQIPSLKICI